MAELALVTGGDTGIGRAIADALEADGFLVRSASRRSGYDLTSPRAIKALIGSLPRLDLLVNNAGIAEAAPLARTTDEIWQRHFDINVTAAFRLSRAALSLLKRAKRPRIINIASTAALRGAPYIAAYAASKHALLGLSRVMQAELAPIAVHAVCPGFVETDLTGRSIREIVSATGRGEEEAREILASQNRGGRLLTPAEVAAKVAELARHGGPGEIILE